MIRANTSARSTSSPPVAVSNPSTRHARDKATRRRAIGRRRDRKWPARCLGIKTEIELKLPRSHTQRRRRLQHREFSIVVC